MTRLARAWLCTPGSARQPPSAWGGEGGQAGPSRRRRCGVGPPPADEQPALAELVARSVTLMMALWEHPPSAGQCTPCASPGHVCQQGGSQPAVTAQLLPAPSPLHPAAAHSLRPARPPAHLRQLRLHQPRHARILPQRVQLSSGRRHRRVDLVNAHQGSCRGATHNLILPRAAPRPLPQPPVPASPAAPPPPHPRAASAAAH